MSQIEAIIKRRIASALHIAKEGSGRTRLKYGSVARELQELLGELRKEGLLFEPERVAQLERLAAREKD